MTRFNNMPREVHEALARGATILTSNQRAARMLNKWAVEQMRSTGSSAWQTPAILPWSGWLHAQWQTLLAEGHESRLLLNRLQERELWTSIIQEDDSSETLQSAEALAEMARDAYALLHRYGARGKLQIASGSPDAQRFVLWLQVFERECRQESLLSLSALEEAIAKHLRSQHSRLAGKYLLYGFDGLTPAQEYLAETMRETGVACAIASVGDPSGSSVSLIASGSKDAELEVTAYSIREFLKTRPEASVAVILPALQERRAQIERVFKRVLAPERGGIECGKDKLPFEFSLGVPLASSAMVACGIDLLRWLVRPLSMDQISSILLSPYLEGPGEEGLRRAEFDAYHLRDRKLKILQPVLSVRACRRILQESNMVGSLFRTSQILKDLEEREVAGHKSYASWIEIVREILEAVGWCKGRTLNSKEFQERQKWDAMLDSIASLDFSAKTVSFDKMLHVMEQAARETLFAPESRDETIQIMGALESAGSQFDAIWFVGASDAEWPAQARRNPLLPWPLQKEAGMPGANAALDFERTVGVTRRISGSSPNSSFVYASATENGAQRPSAVLRYVGATVEVAPSEVRVEDTAVTLEEIQEGKLPALPDEVMKGGSNVLKLQAACGFRAFAEYRLRSKGIDDRDAGLDAAQRGNLVHKALELFWNETQSQEQLRSLTKEERQSRLLQCIDATLSHFPARSQWDRAYLDVQRERLLYLLNAWLEMEATQRAPFRVELSEREFKDVSIGPLRLDIRVDRIDEVDGGGMLIDYKTGHANRSAWLGDRPDEPQLPLYASLLGQQEVELQAVAFANIRPGTGMGLSGFETTAGVLGGKRSSSVIDMPAQIERWRAVLVRLAEEFASGRTDVDPKQYPQTCKYCEQRMLCRVRGDLLIEMEDEQEGSDA